MAATGALGSVLCVLTGASRGFGRTLAHLLCPRLLPGSTLLLVSRTEEALKGLAGELAHKYPGVRVRWEAADLGTSEGVSAAVRAAGELQVGAAQKLLIINNAGSIGDVSKMFVDFSDPKEVTDYMMFNVSSPLCLTASLLKTFPRRPDLQRVVVNVSSLAALQPFKSWALYCSGKAARDMIFRVLAEEEKDVRVLNYAPGPLDTDMHVVARTQTADPELRRFLMDRKEKGKMVDIQVSAKKMLDLLEADAYKSGDHIDFFD
ncbi:sepiapterin reductase [Xenopus tropicalis]|uniref:Sepiapterin reductase n=1 Tax=Xenopus tropicalis TaxID=8364 RepID=SPRE_XENTR|nr:sepiapterin reductase [Xenopus tropicalis]B0BML7.1 RecName: Full=Sepiapterin reductase; Short=SPR [Xenopus tropicalis]AAI58484.1 spr protein [Xenopus tropicalis]|eukprot:NP_001120067.1 sepiapterin reductase [Xenopus tropicalis]